VSDATEPLVILGMPTLSGPRKLDVAKALFLPSRNYEVRAAARQASGLTANFNNLFAAALNARRQTDRPVLFAMLHDDVQPRCEWWLDALIAELDAGPFDVVSAVVPIKDGRGVSSTGIGHPDPDQRWHPLKRFTFRELDGMPGTFTAADVGFPGYPLLVNTGCWVCRLGEWAEPPFAFRFEDRIVRDGDGYVAEFVPEDWAASRWWWERGLRVAATRSVPLTHWGDGAFVNDRPWGSYQTDEDARG